MKIFESAFLCLVLWVSLSVSSVAQTTRPLAGYSVIVVEKAVIEKGPKTDKVPEDYVAVLQQKIIERLSKKKIYAGVIDPLINNDQTSPAGRRIVLSTTIVEFNPGNANLRFYLGLGAGALKIRVRFVFRDPASNEEKLTTNVQGKYAGNFLSMGVEGKNQAISEASDEVTNKLISQIKKNR